MWGSFYENWMATFSESGAEIVIPTHVRYRIEGGRIAEEYGYWNNTLHLRAVQAMEAAGGV